MWLVPMIFTASLLSSSASGQEEDLSIIGKTVGIDLMSVKIARDLLKSKGVRLYTSTRSLFGYPEQLHETLLMVNNVDAKKLAAIVSDKALDGFLVPDSYGSDGFFTLGDRAMSVTVRDIPKMVAEAKKLGAKSAWLESAEKAINRTYRPQRIWWCIRMEKKSVVALDIVLTCHAPSLIKDSADSEAFVRIQESSIGEAISYIDPLYLKESIFRRGEEDGKFEQKPSVPNLGRLPPGLDRLRHP